MSSTQQQGLTKLDISLLAGVALWEVPAPFINLRWLTKKSDYEEPAVMRTCEDMLTRWPSIDPSELDVKGTELIRSPRSALAVLRHGSRVRDLVDSDTHAIHALSRKMKLTNQETARRIELDRERKDKIRHEIHENYQQLCANFDRIDLILAVRRFLFKGEEPCAQLQQVGNEQPGVFEEEEQEKQQQQQHEIVTKTQRSQSTPQRRPLSSSSSSRRPIADAFSRLTCSPSHEARYLLREEEVDDVVHRRDKEAQRLRKRLLIDANHRANRIIKELDLVEALDAENNQADLGHERARQILLERKREVALKNDEREERARLKKEALKREEEERLLELEAEAERHREKVTSFVTIREKRAQAAKMASIRQENNTSRLLLTPTPKKSRMLKDALQFHSEHDQNNNNMNQSAPRSPLSETRRSNSPPHHFNPNYAPAGAASSSSTNSSSTGEFTPSQNQNQQRQQRQRQFTPKEALEIDDLLTEWKVQNARSEKLQRAYELGKKREDAIFMAQERRSQIEREKQLQLKQSAKREQQRANTAAINKQKIESRVNKSFGVLASRIDHAKRFTNDRDLERGEQFMLEFESRMDKSRQLLDAQAQERRRKLIERIYQEDEANDWRVQRKERHELTCDAKKVMFTAEVNDIEEDLERRRAVHKQLARENHLLRKTNLNALHDLAMEEKKILVEMNLRNAIAT